MNAVAEKPAPVTADARSTQTPDLTPGRPAPARRSKSRALRPLAVVVVLIGGVLVGNWWFTEATWIQSTDNAYVQGDIAVLGPRIEGDVITVNVADNQRVHAGDPLLTFDPRDRQAMLDSARGTASEAGAAIGVARRQVELQRAAIAQAEAGIATAKAEQTRALAEAGRSGALVGAGWTSRQSNEQAVADRSKADAQLANASATRDSAIQALAVAQAQVVQAEAKQVTADAQMRMAENNLSYTVVRAPFDGVVGNRAVQVGQHVMPGQQLIAVAPPATKLYVLANFKETQLARMHPGQKVVLTADINTGVPINGRVESLAPATGALFSLLPPENATGNFTKVVQRVPVRIAIDPDEAAKVTWLRAGLSVTAEVDTRGPDSIRHGILGSAAVTLGLR